MAQKRRSLHSPSLSRERKSYRSDFFLITKYSSSFIELTLGKNSHHFPPHEMKYNPRKKSEISLIDLKNPQSLQSLGCVAIVVLLTVFLFFYFKMFEKKMRGQLESSRDGIEGRYRMIGYNR
jgi:hypothetical protein